MMEQFYIQYNFKSVTIVNTSISFGRKQSRVLRNSRGCIKFAILNAIIQRNFALREKSVWG